MSAPKYTAGPWRIGPRHKDGGSLQLPIICNGGSAIAWVNNRNWAAKFEPDCELANARLIAAAPEMLEALREAVEGCPCSLKERDSGHRTECRAPAWAEVLAKAEGRT